MKLPKQFWVVFISILIVVGLVGGLVGYQIARNAYPSSTLTILSAGYPVAPSYTVWTDGMGSYYAKDANGHIVLNGTNAATVIQSGLAALFNGTVVLQPGTFVCNATSLVILSGQKLEGSGIGSTTLVFSGTGGITMGVASGESSPMSNDVALEALTIQGDGSVGSVGLRRTNNEYSTIRDVYIQGFQYGFIEESWNTGINIINTAYNVNVYNCTYAVTWQRRSPSGLAGNNLNEYYGLNALGTTIDPTDGSIGYNSIGGEGNIIYGGLTEDFATGIYINNTNAFQTEGVWQEGCSMYVDLESGAFATTINSILYLASGEAKYIDNGTCNTLVFSKTDNSFTTGKDVYLNGAFTWLTGTGLVREGTKGQLYIGHSASDWMLFNVPSGKGYTFMVNNTGTLTVYPDGSIQYLKVENSGTFTASVPISRATIILPLATADTSYQILITPSWDTTFWVSGKTTGNFTVNFGTISPSTASFDWLLLGQ
jgi:hypothetical protein